MARITLKPGSVVESSGVELVFERELGGSMLVFTRLPTGAPWTIVTEAGASRLPVWSDLEALLAAGDFKIKRDARGPVLENGQRLITEAELDPEQVAVMDRRARVRAHYVRQFDEEQPGLGKKALRLFIAKSAGEESVADFGWVPSTTTVRRWVLDRGEIGDRRLTDMISGSGRAAKTFKYHPLINRAIISCIRWYWTLEGRSHTDAYARLRRMARTMNHRRTRAGAERLKPPSYETLRRYINTAECFDTWVARFGTRAAERRWKPVGEGLKATRILQVCALDHTVLDGWCVFDARRRLPVGRPWLVILLDVFSRCVVGWFLSFEPPCIASAAECIKRANRPKPWLAERFPSAAVGAIIYGKPGEIVMDNAWENVGRSMRDALLDLGISLRFAPVATPTYKAVVERFFHTLNLKLAHKLPGAVHLDIETMRKLGYDPERDAVLTIEEAEELIEEAIHAYHHTVHQGLNAPPALVWKKSAEAGINVLRDDSLLMKTLGTAAQGVLDRRGIRFKNLWYFDREVVASLMDKLVCKQRVRGRRKNTASAIVKFKHFGTNLGHIQVFDPVNRIYFTLPAKNLAYADGLTTYQHETAQELAREENLAFITEEDQLAVLQRLRSHIETAAPELRARARRSLARLAKSPSRTRAIEGDKVRLAIALPSADGLLELPNDGLAKRRTDDGETAPGRKPAKRRKPRAVGRPAAAPPAAALPAGARPMSSVSFGDGGSPDEDGFLAAQGW